MADEMKACVVCGQGSTRTDWINKSPDGKLVACDQHTKEEFQKAIADTQPVPKLVATPSAKPSGPVSVPSQPVTPATPAPAPSSAPNDKSVKI